MAKVSMDVKLDFANVLIRPKRSTLKSRSAVTLERSITFKHSKRTFTGIPIMAANMDTTGTFDMAEALASNNMMTAIHKHYTPDQWQQWTTKLRANGNEKTLQFIAASTGILDDDWQTLTAILADNDIPMICLDVANGYSEHFVNFVRRVREKWPTHTIMAGNVVTGEMVEELTLSGADIVKVGIGPGSVCTTRKKTGVGYPQLSAVLECSDAAHGLGGMICSDGGCNSPGDVAKAFGGGADFVMMGGMFSGHTESGGEHIRIGDKEFVEFYGMSSATAMQKHVGKVAEYRASEGKTVRVPFKGSVHATALDILGGLRSACTYVGADTLKDLPKRTTFIRVSQQTNDIYGTSS